MAGYFQCLILLKQLLDRRQSLIYLLLGDPALHGLVKISSSYVTKAKVPLLYAIQLRQLVKVRK